MLQKKQQLSLDDGLGCSRLEHGHETVSDNNSVLTPPSRGVSLSHGRPRLRWLLRNTKG